MVCHYCKDKYLHKDHRKEYFELKVTDNKIFSQKYILSYLYTFQRHIMQAFSVQLDLPGTHKHGHAVQLMFALSQL